MAHKAYIRHTDGNTIVLFIHGFLGSPELFEQFYPYVPEDCGICNTLLEGHGGSVRDFSKASMAKWKAQVDTVLRELMQKYEKIIIAAHSMGTFFAMDAAVKYPDRIQAIVLLQTPLKIFVKFSAVSNSLKSSFGRIAEKDEVVRAFRDSCSITHTKRFWRYIGWVPRCLELFAESKRSRDTIQKLAVPCYVFQAEKDELVSIKSVRFIPKKDNIHTSVLPDSRHFIYSAGDAALMSEAFCRLF